MIQSSRKVFRLLAHWCLMALPAAGLLLVIWTWPREATAPFIGFASIMASALVHACLLQDFSWRGRYLNLTGLIGSAFGLLLVVLVLQLALRVSPGFGTVLAVEGVILGWLLGAWVAVMLRAAQRFWVRIAGTPGSSQFGVSLAGFPVLALVIWIGSDLLALVDPALTLTLPRATQAMLIGLSALYLLAAAAPYDRAISGLGARHLAPATGLPILAFLAAVALAAAVAMVPGIAALGAAGASALYALGLGLVLVLVLRHPPSLLALGYYYVVSLPMVLLALISGRPAAAGLAAVFLLASYLSAKRNADAVEKRTTGTDNTPSPQVMAQFSQLSEAWLMRIDLEDRLVHFPWGSGRSLGYGDSATFSELFIDTNFSGILTLLSGLQEKAPTAISPITLQLRTPLEHGAERSQKFLVQVLERHDRNAWLALTSLRGVKELSAKAERFEERLSAAMLREERLLSVAAHELRTPVAILSMLTDELKAGMEWSEIGASFEKTLARVMMILDDLRADGGAAGGLAAQASFTMRELSLELQTVFAPAAEANGCSLRFSLPEQANRALRGDHGRVFIALSKVLHNAITHSGGTEIQIDGFIVKGEAGVITVTWQISDNGTGIAAEDRERIFDPFETASSDVSERAGLGLYTARKAIRLIGGDLTLHSDVKGSRFVLAHPARYGMSPKPQPKEPTGMTEGAVHYPKLAALLIEDNRLVGEITCARLQKLFHKVDWAESGDAGLAMFLAGEYHFIVVDQMMPGMIGSDVVREIRKTNREVPIIGFTASTMGSECHDLETAGVNYALEKPLSFTQLKALAEELLGPPQDG